MSKHTPGPWEVLAIEQGGFKIVPKDDHNFKICRIENSITYLMDFDDRAEPDARLIAAAPESHDANKAALSWLERWGTHARNCGGGLACTCGLTRVKFDLSSAVAKAEGR